MALQVHLQSSLRVFIYLFQCFLNALHHWGWYSGNFGFWGVFRTSVRFRCQLGGSKVHAHCGRNPAITVSVPPEPQVVGSPALPPIPPYYHSSGVHARCCGIYYSCCSLYITLHASHTLDRVLHPLIGHGRRSRPAVPHHLFYVIYQKYDQTSCPNLIICHLSEDHFNPCLIA